jgi:hypothetical protein
MIPDPKWLEALNLPLKVTIAVALAAGVLLSLDLLGWLDLGVVAPVSRTILVIVTVVFTVLALVGIVDFFMMPFHEKRKQSVVAARRAVRRAEERDARADSEARILTRLDHLSRDEMRYVAECLAKNTPTFYTYVHAPPVGVLLGKELIWTDGAQHHQDHYPFSFHDFVWRALMERKDEFLAKEAAFRDAEEAQKRARARSPRY